jgi:hypothetical protein
MTQSVSAFAEDMRADSREKVRQLHSRTVPYFYRGTFLINPFAGNGTQETVSELERSIREFENWQSTR